MWLTSVPPTQKVPMLCSRAYSTFDSSRSMDFVVSYWALYHLPSPDAQCALASELVSKLRVGGKAWFGGNMPSMALNIEFTPMTRALWEDCFRTLYSKAWRSRNFSADIEMIEDLTLFRKM